MRKIRTLVGMGAAAVLFGAIVPARASAQTVWDLVAMAGTGGSLGASQVFNNGLFGSITVYSALPSTISVFAKDFGQPLTDNEHGLGVCGNTAGGGTNCSKDLTDEEIGDYAGGWLIVDLNLTNGSVLQGFQLGSVQSGPDETWKAYYMNSATCNASTDFSGASSYSGSGPNVSGTSITTQSTVGNTADCYLFAEPSSIVGDYLLQSITTSEFSVPKDTVPEPASLSLLATGLVGLVAAGRRRRKSGI